MFNYLLGGKFSNKCKHSVKYIKCRIEVIRKKKQVMVRYLKKDVADLLAGGHDANAFGRIDALIVEMNHASCYDMIEQYCGCLLEHLSTMCKERECPKEAMEAVATLIFAAARFSDLPELADLRTVFNKRYGTRMESCINKEFVEKIQKKSFSKFRKLQLMEDIAHEFSVNWNSNVFENKISNKSTSSHIHPTKPQNVIKEHEKQFPMIATQKHQIQPKEQKDFQTTATNANIHAHETTEIIVKMTSDELENAKSDHPDNKASVQTICSQNEKYINDSLFEGSAGGRSSRVHDGIGLVATDERQPSSEVVYKDLKAINTPQYTRSTECSNGTIADHGNFINSEASVDIKELDHNAQDRRAHRPVNSSGRRTFNRQPPYRKPSINKTPNDTNYVDPTDNEKSTQDNEKSTEGQGNDHSKDKMPKDELLDDDANLISQIQTKQARESTRTNGIQGEVYDRQRLIIKQTPSSHRSHGSRRAVEDTKYGGLDKEEEIMDKLLMRYSKKGIKNEPRKTRLKIRGDPKDPMADAERVSENPDESKHHPNTITPMATIVISLPQELTSPAENGVKSRARVGSMQTWRKHLRRPENGNLAAWIAQH